MFSENSTCTKTFSLSLTTLPTSFLKAHDCILLIKLGLKKRLHFVSSFLKQLLTVPLDSSFSALPLSFKAHCYHFIELLISIGLRVAIVWQDVHSPSMHDSFSWLQTILSINRRNSIENLLSLLYKAIFLSIKAVKVLRFLGKYKDMKNGEFPESA